MNNNSTNIQQINNPYIFQQMIYNLPFNQNMMFTNSTLGTDYVPSSLNKSVNESVNESVVDLGLNLL